MSQTLSTKAGQVQGRTGLARWHLTDPARLRHGTGAGLVPRLPVQRTGWDRLCGGGLPVQSL